MLTFSRDPEADFWTDFVEQYWEKEPAVLNAGDPATLPSLDDVYAAVTHMPRVGPNDRFWLAAQETPRSRDDFAQIDLSLMGPQPSDGGFDGFFHRLSAHSFGINIHRLDKGNPAFQGLVEDVSGALALAPGPTAYMWLSDTFIGNYPATPFGIHRDPAGVLSFTLEGTRTYYTWPPEAFFDGHPDLGTPDPDVIARHLPNAERFDVQPGSLMYWPSNRWHLVTSPGEPFVVAQVSAYFRPEDVGQA